MNNLRHTVWFRDLWLLRWNVGVTFFVLFSFSCFNLALLILGVGGMGLLLALPFMAVYLILSLIRPLRFLRMYHIALFLLSCTAFVLVEKFSDSENAHLYWMIMSIAIPALQIASAIVFLKPENYFGGPETANR